MTESEQAIRRALHALSIMDGNRVFDLPRLRRILEEGCTETPERN
ncbi:hypothetical protein [Pseudarthrobacter sp. S9]